MRKRENERFEIEKKIPGYVSYENRNVYGLEAYNG